MARAPVGFRTGSGRELNRRWNIGAQQAFFHKDGTWFNVLERFPGALCDPHGYVLFGTRNEYDNCPHLKIGRHTNVPGGIHQITTYVRME